MYSSRGGNSYGQQQPYVSQSGYTQNLGSAYSGSSAGGPDAGSQPSIASRHLSMLGGPQESDITGYRSHPSSGAHYGGQYSALYGSAALSSGQQVPGMSTKAAGPSSLESRGGYGSAMPDSTKLTTGDYTLSSSHGYGHKSDQLFSDKIPDYPSVDRYGERRSAYAGRDLQNVTTGHFGDSISFDNQHKPDMYERMDQALLLRQEQMLKAQSLQSASLDGGSRQADYLAARGGSIRHSAQDLMSYGGRVDADPRGLSVLSGSSYGGQHAASILGAAPRRNVDDLMYAQSSSNPGYGVSLPPGRDYATGKGLQDASLDLDYPRGGHSRIDERKDDRSGYVRELERREERRREHLREREKDREREKERERERERDRERKRERERERERLLERREKERDRERERGPEIRRERGPDIKRDRTPPRISRERAERHGSPLTKDVRPPRRDSPHHEPLHRRHSPVKEKRREYECKVYSSSLVDVERDYLSLDKRYPRLFISPECSKVVVNWPRENLRLSIHTPVSFEHDFVEEDAGAEQKVPPAITSADKPVKSESATTVWNAKMILMSGLSQNALEDLSSEKSYDDRIPHFCNILRFAVLKKDHSLMAIGGPWDTVDEGDPSVDDSSLLRTVLRYAKDVTHLDLKNCRHWNRFLEIHYDRVGKDGFFSHKEVTVLYVPDLSDCIPSLDAWRDQWFAHKKAIAERRRLLAAKKEKSREKEMLQDKESDPSKEVKGDDKSAKKIESASPGQAVLNKKQKDDHKVNGSANAKEGGEKENSEKIGGVTTGDEGNTIGKKELGGSAGVQTTGSGKLGKKKIVKKVVKQKVADKKEGSGDPTNPSDKVDEKTMGEKNANSEVTAQQDVSPANAAGVKTFIRKKVVKKVPVAKTVKIENEGMQPEVKTDKEPEFSEDKPKVESDSINPAVVQDATGKTTAKKKVIKRVVKRKVTGAAAIAGVSDSKKDDKKDGKMGVPAEKEAKILGEPTVDADSNVGDANAEKKITPKTTLKPAAPKKQDNSGNSNKAGCKVEKEDKRAEKALDEKSESASKIGNEADKQKVSHKDSHSGKREKSKEREKSKGEEKKDKQGKDDSRNTSSKEVKEKKQLEEPPRHPGLFLQTKGSKDSKLRSLSLSLDSLLDYTDKDFEESTFELSLFAESLYEMLQYQMGSRILTFLQKLRIKFVMKRNQRKRQREEISKGSDKKSSAKRAKTDEATVEAKSTKMEAQDAAPCDDGKIIVKEEDTSVGGKSIVKAADTYVGGKSIVKEDTSVGGKSIVKEEDTSVDGVENVKLDDEMGDDEKPEDEMGDEDPEEDPEEDEDEEMLDPSHQHDLSNEDKAVVGKNDNDTKFEKVVENATGKEQETAKETSESKSNAKDKGNETAKGTSESKPNARDKGNEIAKEASESKPMPGSESRESVEKMEAKKGETKKRETPVVADKELLQAFRFFDRNRVGYIRVEDMRLIIHNLGKFLSYKDVKELAQSALLESNTGRDDRILYNKLARMTDI